VERVFGHDESAHSPWYVKVTRKSEGLRMITEQQQEQASLYVLGAMTPTERRAFEDELRVGTELRELVRGLQRTTDLLAMSLPTVSPPRELRGQVLRRVEIAQATGIAAGEQSAAVFPG